MRKIVFFCFFTASLVIGASSYAWSMTDASSLNLTSCLKNTDDSPDLAAAQSDMWQKQGGGFQAKLCHAFAQFKRNQFQDAAKEFSDLAGLKKSKDAPQAASLYAQAGLSYARSQNYPEAERAYISALKLEPNDAEILIDRATERSSAQRFWDAISDLNQAIKIDPKEYVALRLRGQAWIKLGNTRKAEEDFLAAEEFDPQSLSSIQK